MKAVLSIPFGMLGGALFAMTLGLPFYLVLKAAGLRMFEALPNVSPLLNDGLFAVQLAYILASLSLGFIVVAGLLLAEAPLRWFSAVGRFRFTHLGLGSAAAAFAGALGFALTDWLENRQIGGAIAGAPLSDILLYVALIVSAFTIMAISEEIIFRSYLQRLIDRLIGSSPVLIITLSAGLFSILHFEFSPPLLAVRFISGLAYGWAVWRLAGLEFAIGAHATGNIMIALFAKPLAVGEAIQPGLADVAIEIFGALILVGCTEAMARRRSAAPNIRSACEMS